MPGKNQKTVTLRKEITQKAKKYFKKHRKELTKQGVTSWSALVAKWIREKTSDSEIEKEVAHARAIRKINTENKED